VTGVAVTGRADLTDAQWAVLESLLPVATKPGRPPKWTRRQLIDGIRWRVRAGTPWWDVPPEYGSWQAVYGLFRRWQGAGVWAAVLARLQARCDAVGLITWDVSVDSTIARAHQHAAGARKKGLISVSLRVGWGNRSRPITRWDAGGVAGPPSCVWPPSRDRSRCRWWSRRGSEVTRRSFRSCWAVFAWPGWAVVGPGFGRIGCGGQGLQFEGQPRLPAFARDHRDHPSQGRPGRPPAGERLGRWAATGVRLCGLPAASRRGVRHQSAQTQPCRGHPLRQARRSFTRRPSTSLRSTSGYDIETRPRASGPRVEVTDPLRSG
jgi:transposase